jgi:hypothetical protein
MGGNFTFPTWADALEAANSTNANLTVLVAALNATGEVM